MDGWMDQWIGNCEPLHFHFAWILLDHAFIHSLYIKSGVESMLWCHAIIEDCWGASCLKSNGRKRARNKKQYNLKLQTTRTRTLPYHTLYCSCMNVSRVLYFFGWNYSTDGMTWHGMAWHDWIESCERLHFDFQTTDWLCVMWRIAHNCKIESIEGMSSEYCNVESQSVSHDDVTGLYFGIIKISHWLLGWRMRCDAMRWML